MSGDLGRSKKKVKFTSLLSKVPAINWLSAARLFLFASRDVWFVVGLPVFLSELGWSFSQVGAFLALWVIGYGVIQAAVPEILRTARERQTRLTVRPPVVGPSFSFWYPLAWWWRCDSASNREPALIVGLAAFAVVFAINSAVHSYLVLAYTDEDSVAVDVGFYYMANAGGRLLGTLLSGLVFEIAGFEGCLVTSAALVLASALLALKLPRGNAVSLNVAISASD